MSDIATQVRRLTSHAPALGGRRWSAPLTALLFIVAAARCGSDDITSPPFADPASAAVAPGEKLATVAWNEQMQAMVGKYLPNQHAALRDFAYLTLAQHAAVEAAAERNGVTRAAIRGAVAGASVPVLAYLFPADAGGFESKARAEEASLPEAQRTDFRTGEALGRALGTKAVARAQDDRFNAAWTGSVPTSQGKWTSLAVPPVPPLQPLLGEMRPFFLGAGNQFRPAAPPAFDSPAFREALGEVRRISDTRTPTQDSIAKFWVLGTGSLIAGFWNITAIDVTGAQKFGERATAHALALMNTAAMDGLIACMDAKYAYWLVRPSGADPAIRLATGLPNHPSYPSNHACLSGAAASILAKLSPSNNERLKTMANDAAMSRI